MKKLTMFEKSPLITAVVEIRFSHMAGDIVPGLIYNALSEKYKQPPEELPTNQIPVQIRNTNPGLIYSPTHKLSKGNKSIAFGPRSVSLAYDVFTKNAYPGWKAVKLELENIVNLLAKAGLLNKAERIGVRYINFFQDKDLLSNLTLKVESVWSKAGVLDEEMNVGVLLVVIIFGFIFPNPKILIGLIVIGFVKSGSEWFKPRNILNIKIRNEVLDENPELQKYFSKGKINND